MNRQGQVVCHCSNGYSGQYCEDTGKKKINFNIKITLQNLIKKNCNFNKTCLNKGEACLNFIERVKTWVKYLLLYVNTFEYYQTFLNFY